MRTLAVPTISFLFFASLLGCSGTTAPDHEAAQGGGSGNPAAVAGSGGAAIAAGGSNSGSGGGTSIAGAGAGAGTGGSAGSGGAAGAGIAGASAASACDKSMASWTDADDLWASNDYGPNFLRKNFWNHTAAGAGNLTLWAASSRCWGVDATSDDSGSAGTVKSYPDMARGWVVGTAGFQNKDSGLPIQVKDLTKAKIRWSMTVSGSPIRHYALWDIYFHDTATPGKGIAPVNLMIKQRVVDPSNYEQDKESAGSAAVTQTFSGITFRENKNTGLKSGSRIVIELFATPVNGVDMGVDDMTLDLKEVIDHYVQDGSILTTDYLTSIQAGWEIVAGGTFVTNDFWTALQDEPEPTN
ncbi:MAG: hypothetical protein WDO69_14445 [Pseudomonadota bacterium]